MSDNDAPTTETVDEGAEQQDSQDEGQRPTETVEFWKSKARDQERRAKENAAAAKRLAEIEDAQRSESEKFADRLAKADAEVASVPQKVAESLRAHLIELHSIEADDAELFLTANDPDVLVKQVNRLMAQRTSTGPKPNPQQGNPSEGRGGSLSSGRSLYESGTK